MKRRHVIQTLLGAPAIAAIPLPAQTPQTRRPSDESFKLTTATPDAVGDAAIRAFTAPQLAALRKLGDLIVPAGTGRPSARDAGAPEFLDFLISQSPAARQTLYRTGLDHLQSESRKRFNAAFESLDPQQADAILAPLHSPWTYGAPTDPFAQFLRAAKDDLLAATFNSREYAEAQAAAGRRSSGMGTYWYPVE
jgi:hypothetical protein